MIEYWIVDRDVEVVRIYRRRNRGFVRPVELSPEAGDILRSDLLPGLEMPLRRIFGARREPERPESLVLSLKSEGRKP